MLNISIGIHAFDIDIPISTSGDLNTGIIMEDFSSISCKDVCVYLLKSWKSTSNFVFSHEFETLSIVSRFCIKFLFLKLFSISKLGGIMR